MSSTAASFEQRHERPAALQTRKGMNLKKPYFKLVADGTKTVEKT